MSYTVEYGAPPQKRRIRAGLIVALVLVFVLALRFAVRTQLGETSGAAEAGVGALWDAVQAMAGRLRGGEPFGQAAAAVCREIIQNASLPPA